jgi:hypothetical protein
LEQLVHDISLLFAGLPAALVADGVGCGIMRAGIKPAGQNGSPGELWRFKGEVGEHALGDILREMGVAVDLAQGSGVNEVKMSLHQFGERLFFIGLGVVAEQFTVRCHAYAYII